MTAHLIAPVCATCGGEIDKTNQGWVHVRLRNGTLAGLSTPLPGEPDLSKATTAPSLSPRAMKDLQTETARIAGTSWRPQL